MREALRELEILRLVESEPFRGARVRAVRADEIAESYPVRAALEELAAKLAAARLAGGAAPLARRDRRDARGRGGRRPARVRPPRRRLPPACSSRRARNRTLVEVWESLHVDLRTRFTLIQRLEDLAEVAESHVPSWRRSTRATRERAGRLVREHIEGFGRWFVERGTDPADREQT